MSFMRAGSFDPFRGFIRRSQAVRRLSSVFASSHSPRASSENTKKAAGTRSFRSGAMNDVFDSVERDFMMLPGWGSAFRFPGAHHNMLAGMDAAVGIGGVDNGRFGMHLDFHETETSFELTADLPGVRKDDITVDVDRESGVLTVSGERKSNREERKNGGGGGGGGGGGEEEKEGGGGERKYHFVERSYGKTTRSIRLPETADVSKASAEFSGGVLSLTFPKREVPATTRHIKIPVEEGGGIKAIGDDNKVSAVEGGGVKTTTDGDSV